MRLVRRVFFWTHLVVGVSVALVVLVMSVTGVLLTYERQMIARAELRGLDGSPPTAGARPLSSAALIAAAAAADAPGRPTAITWRADPNAPVTVAFGREGSRFLNAYTGQVVSDGAPRVRAFFTSLRDWHRWLGQVGDARDAGRAITGAANLGFLFLVVSGFYLWWPRNWTRQTFRAVLWFRGGLSGKARDFNWHHAIGFWSLVPLFVIVLSGVVISYRWAGDLVYRAAGEAPPPPPAEGGGGGGPKQKVDPAEALGGLDPLLASAERRDAGWRILTLTVPKPGADSVRFTVDRGTGGQPQARATLVLDRATGGELKWEPFSAVTPGRRARLVLRFAHTGEVLGIFGQTLAGLVTLGAAFLVWTGLALSLRRFLAWRGRRGGGSSQPPSTRRSKRRATAEV